jgi:hypothetical protein
MPKLPESTGKVRETVFLLSRPFFKRRRLEGAFQAGDMLNAAPGPLRADMAGS